MKRIHQDSDTGTEDTDFEEDQEIENEASILLTFGLEQVYPESDTKECINFAGVEGLISQINVPSDPENSVEFFANLFFTPELIEHIVNCTNHRAEQDFDKAIERIGPDGKLSGSLAKWRMCMLRHSLFVIR